MSDDRAARSVMLSAWALARPGDRPTLAELQASQAVACLETGYGQWKGAGAGSNNWGAVQCCQPKDGVCPPDTFEHGDFNSATGKDYRVCFKRYPTAEEGAADLVRNLIAPVRPRTGEAMKTADGWAISSAMYREHYYGGFHVGDDQANIRDHCGAVLRHAKRIAAALGEPLALRAPSGSPATPPGRGPAPEGSGLVGLFFLAGVGLLLAVARR